jgi:hypothetical protein
MTYFTSRDLAGITIFAALWGILNSLLSPIFFQIFHMPFLCDIIGFATLTIALWWVRKIGTATLTGFIATLINFIIRPTAFHFLGFTIASIIFDVLASLIGYERLFQKRVIGSVILFSISVFSAAFAGLIIGSFFLVPVILQQWGGILVWSGLHALGGIIGGVIGVALINALMNRGITVKAI